MSTIDNEALNELRSKVFGFAGEHGLTLDEIFERGPSEEEKRNQDIEHRISHLNQLNYQIAELRRIKEEVESRLKELFRHGDEGQKTYYHGDHAVTITTGWNYKLNKKEYEILKHQLRPEFNPVMEKIEYRVSAPKYREAEEYGSRYDIDMLSKLVPKEHAKIRVTIKPNTDGKD